LTKVVLGLIQNKIKIYLKLNAMLVTCSEHLANINIASQAFFLCAANVNCVRTVLSVHGSPAHNN